MKKDLKRKNEQQKKKLRTFTVDLDLKKKYFCSVFLNDKANIDSVNFFSSISVTLSLVRAHLKTFKEQKN